MIKALYDDDFIAIPSYSEVLFLLQNYDNYIILYSYSNRNPFLFRGPIPTGYVSMKPFGSKKSQSLLIQRSYSYMIKEVTIEQVESQSLLIQRSYSYF